MSFAKDLTHLQELIRVRQLSYRSRIAMLWLLALACWLVPWYTAIPMIACALMTAGWAWHDTKAYYRLLDQRCALLAGRESGPSLGVFR